MNAQLRLLNQIRIMTARRRQQMNRPVRRDKPDPPDKTAADDPSVLKPINPEDYGCRD